MKLRKDGKPRKKRILSRQKKPKQPKPAPKPVAEKKPSRYIPKKTREFVLERDGNKCVRCGRPDELILHHKLPFSEGGTSDAANLETLCWACHKAVHLERGDFYATKMASSKREFVDGVTDYSHTITQVLPDFEGLQLDFGLSEKEAQTLYWIRYHSLRGVYPSIANLATAMKADELELAKRMLALREKELLFTTIVPERQNCYTLAKAKLADYFAIKVFYYDEDDNVMDVMGADVPKSKLAREADVPVRIITA